MKGSKPTSQSSAFLIVPLTPWAYSGVAMTSASARATAACSACTASGGAVSRSGLNSGSAPSDGAIVTATLRGARRANARSNAALIEAARRLPHSASTARGGGETMRPVSDGAGAGVACGRPPLPSRQSSVVSAASSALPLGVPQPVTAS